ncbi:hypothetical protein B0T10DRAFT_492944 [Thelonectria olida]|uniref:Rhodopsin domain-containing protein n=1 Tax=Thelonectria olida TaxID=1576542 RepID=A0A9P8W103_9HYPO|nr:hypothetical protein B0T10DRAFT_492944 [Thelonectria olida]
MVNSSESQLPGLPGFNPHNIQPWTMTVVIAMTVLALASVACRIWSRHLKGQKLWWDDYMIVFSMAWNLIVVGFIFAMHACGMGLHADLVDTGDIVMMAKWLVVAEVLYAWNLGWTKISLLLMYYRIFHVPYFKKMAWILGAFVMAWVICITFLFIFICIPVQKLWYPQLPGRCINQVGTWIANAASTIFTDVCILLLPLPPIWKLQLGKSEKIGLSLAFGLGFFVVFASAYRTSVLFTYTATDPTYTLAPTVGWTDIEMSAGIISACLPTMLPVMKFFLRITGLGRLLSTVNGSSVPVFGSRTGTSTKGLSSQINPDSRQGTTSDSNGRGDSFYRLPDETDSDGLGKSGGIVTTAAAADAKLRPDTQGYQFTVNSFKSTSDQGNESGDDIPLHGIRVQKKFHQATSEV